MHLSIDRSPAQARRTLAAIESIVGLGAVYGGFGLLDNAERFGAKREWLSGSVFPDYTIPGLVLLVVIGGGMVATAAITLCASRYATPGARVMGALLLAWGVVETLTIGYVGADQVVLVFVFVIVPGLALIILPSRGARTSGSDVS